MASAHASRAASRSTLMPDGLLPVVVQDHLTGELRMFALRDAGGHPEDPRDRAARRSGAGRAGRALGEGPDEREPHPACTACWSTATQTASCTRASREGPTCHTGATSCFFQTLEQDGKASSAGDRRRRPCSRALEAVLEARKKSTTAARLHEVPLRRRAGGDRREDPRGGGRARPGRRERERRAGRQRGGRHVYHLLVGLRSRAIWRESCACSITERRERPRRKAGATNARHDENRRGPFRRRT